MNELTIQNMNIKFNKFMKTRRFFVKKQTYIFKKQLESDRI